MNTSTLNDGRVGVVLRFQSIAKRFPPGSEPFEAADRAVHLAMSSRRSAADADSLFYQAWRDAKRINRRRRRQEFLLDPLTEGSDLGRAIAEGREVGGVGRQSTCDLAEVRDLEERLREGARRLGTIAGRCFESMLAEDSVAESAARLGQPSRRIKRLRAQIREMAQTFIARPEAA